MKGYKKILRGELEAQLPMKFYSVYEPYQYNITNEGDYVFQIKCKIIEPCFLRIIWLEFDDRKIHKIGQPFNFLVQNPQIINLKGLTIQTVLPNLVRKWDLDGFQAFHLSPKQEVSHSLYAIKDHLSIKYFHDFKELQNFIKSSKKIFFIDIVLNHVAKESEWLNEEECVHNDRIIPQLRSAQELDIALEQVQKYEDIEQVIKLLKMEEYFQIDFYRKQIRQIVYQKIYLKMVKIDQDDNIFIESNQEKIIKLLEQYQSNCGVSRFGVIFDFKRFKKEQGNHNLIINQIKNGHVEKFFFKLKN